MLFSFLGESIPCCQTGVCCMSVPCMHGHSVINIFTRDFKFKGQIKANAIFLYS